MILLALLFYFRQHGTRAAPSIFEPPGYDTTLFIRDGFVDNPCSGRSVREIVWSCLATTFAVTWVSVHPNVPFLEEASWSMLKRRIFLMCLALLAPEAMIIWAFKQWRGAVMIKDAFNKACPKSCKPWTMAHAHFLQMGGFKLRGLRRDFGSEYSYEYHATNYTTRMTDDGELEYEGVLKFSDFAQLLADGKIELHDVREEEIKDRSKSDALSKGVALLQISWFIAQLIERTYQNLAITEIEITTAALAGLNSIMYLFWWNKPFNIRCPIVVRTKELERLFAGTGNTEQVVKQERWSFYADMNGRVLHENFDLKSYLITNLKARGCLFRAINYHHGCPLWRSAATWLYYPAGAVRTPMVNETGVGRYLDWIWTCCKSAITRLLYLPYLIMFLPIDQIFLPHATPNLSSFKDAKHKMDDTSSLQMLFNEDDMKWIMSMMFYSEHADTKPLLIFSALAGATFGSIHCAVWNYDFPSTAEQILWRVSSVTIVGVCLVIIAGRPLHDYIRAMWECAFFPEQQFSGLAMRTFKTIPAIMYSVSRFCLLTLSILSLRKLPDSAFQTVTWTKLIPHI